MGKKTQKSGFGKIGATLISSHKSDFF